MSHENQSRRALRFRDGDGPTVKKGKINTNHQRCRGTLDVPGTVENAFAYKMECTLCGFVYGANSGDVLERKCPNCQGGAPGIRYWLIARKVPASAAGANGPTIGNSAWNTTPWKQGRIGCERISGSMKDIPEAVNEEFVKYSRMRLGRQGNRAPGDCR